MSAVTVKSYSEPEYNTLEILRYAGMRGASEDILRVIEECQKELCGKLSYRTCRGEFGVKVSGGEVDFGFMKVHSSALAKNLSGCDSAVIFAATVGIEIDRLIAKYGSISPTKALIFQAIGAERIEALCGELNEEVKSEADRVGRSTRVRFSAGYGDFPLEAQKDIIEVLGAAKKIGVTLNKSLLMSPSKSVTAVIGISRAEQG